MSRIAAFGWRLVNCASASWRNAFPMALANRCLRRDRAISILIPPSLCYGATNENDMNMKASYQQPYLRCKEYRR